MPLDRTQRRQMRMRLPFLKRSLPSTTELTLNVHHTGDLYTGILTLNSERVVYCFRSKSNKLPEAIGSNNLPPRQLIASSYKPARNLLIAFGWEAGTRTPIARFRVLKMLFPLVSLPFDQ